MLTDKYETKVKILLPIHGYKHGQMVNVPVDKNGVPLDKIWRRRFNDRKFDKCIELIEDDKKNKKAVDKKNKDGDKKEILGREF